MRMFYEELYFKCPWYTFNRIHLLLIVKDFVYKAQVGAYEFSVVGYY